MSLRVAGLIDGHVAVVGSARGGADHAAAMVAAVEEYAPEASILKVWGTEAMGWAADETLQFHGGYGFVATFLHTTFG